ncbi:LytR/AlgR family response regulator transcription factor [Chitinophaga defluvii]|uniref:LytTR family DNA-binding domain-containing protein n=1 Tax=Chitinophaga defluvii TaxID=3163343 RepID=A0ABV2TB68_9BACT
MQSFFFIHLKGKFVRINVKDIKYALAVAHHVKICADQGTFIPHLSLKQLETFLPAESFSRVNRGTLVALNRIMSFDKDEVVLKDIRFSFSDKYRKELESKITVMLHQERFSVKDAHSGAKKCTCSLQE